MESRQSYLRSDPNADPIMKIIHGARKFKLLEKALEIGIFDELQSSPHPVPAVRLAKKHGFNLDKFIRFMDALCSIQLVCKTVNHKGKSLYYNDVSTSKYLTRSHKGGLIALAMMESKMVLPLFDNLPAMMENGNVVDVMSDKCGVNTSMLFAPQPIQAPSMPVDGCPNDSGGSLKALEAQMKFLMCMDGVAAPCARSLVTAFNLESHETAVDLGGGPGTIGIDLARTYPSMEVTILDLPHVVQAAKKMKPNLPENVFFFQGNFFEDPLPAAQLYILSHVIHDWDEEHVTALLMLVYNTMSAGTSLLILEKLLNEHKDGPQLAVSYNLAMSMVTKGRERTESEYRCLLANHGFENIAVKRLDGYNLYDAILCRKPLDCQ